MVDMGDGRVEAWQCVLLLAILFWEAFAPEDPHCHTGGIRIALKLPGPAEYLCGSIDIYISIFICISPSRCEDWSFALGKGGKVRVDTLPNCTRNQVILGLLHEKNLTSDLCHTLNVTRDKVPPVTHPGSALPALLLSLCNPFTSLNDTPQTMITSINIQHYSGAQWDIITIQKCNENVPAHKEL